MTAFDRLYQDAVPALTSQTNGTIPNTVLSEMLVEVTSKGVQAMRKLGDGSLF